METNRLLQFNTLYQTGSLRRAAELLGISHSGLSKSMSTLEAEINEKLFIQSGRGISFTDHGHEFAKKIPNFLEKLNDLMSKEDSISKPVIKIGSFEVFTTYFAKLMGPLFNDYDLDFNELVPGQMEKALLNREIDLAITYEPIPIPGVEHLEVTQIEMGAFVRKGAFKGLDIQSIPFAAPIIPVVGAASGIKGLDSWPDQFFKREIKFRVDLMETAISLARNGHCAVFVPQFIVKLHNELVKDEYHLIKKDLPHKMKAIKRKVYIIKRESTLEDEKIKKIALHLRKI